MKSSALLIPICLISLLSCDFRKSVNISLNTGLVTKGNGLSCEEVQLSIGEEAVSRNTIIYGENFKLNFHNIEGFEMIENHVFPGMKLVVTRENGDTVLLEEDLYSDMIEGTDQSPLLLKSSVTAANPIHSNGAYNLFVRIWDKKSDAFFTAKLEFTVVPNDQIQIDSNNLTYKEIYLYSQQRRSVIADNVAYFNENIYIMVEGLEGFVKEQEEVAVGMSMKIRDSEGNLIINEDDLLDRSGVAYADLHAQLSANFILNGSQINNPVDCELFIWDKRGTGSMKISTVLQIEQQSP
jgi:hypothetical protein